MYIREKSVASVDFGIITALPIERDAVIERLHDYRKVRNEAVDIRTYYWGQVTISNGAYQVVVVLTGDAGNVDAVATTSDLIRHFNPRYIVMIGIAGGIPRDGLALGDVVVADQVIEYEYTKESDGSTEIRPRAHRCDALLLNRVRDMSDWAGSVQLPRPAADNGKPKLLIGPIASGNKIIAGDIARERIRKIHRRILAVEMESEGVAAAAWQLAEPKGVLVVRGISDLANSEKDDRWQRYAASSAAGFFIDFLLTEPVTIGEGGRRHRLFRLGQDSDDIERFYES